MKRLKVGLLEIPISTREKLTGMDDIGYYKTPVISFPKTGGLRGELEKKIKKFFKNNGEIEIENDYLYLGERGKELEHEDFIRIGKNLVLLNL